ncbi:MAG: T9SS type A sorting domain-containing protein [Deltaproteobacteria bacterium]
MKKNEFYTRGFAPPILAICKGLRYDAIALKLALLFCFLLLQTYSFSQITCGSDFLNTQASNSNGNGNISGPSCPSLYSSFYIEIPVIVHVMYNNEFENVNFDQVYEMISNANSYLLTEPIDGHYVSIQLKLADIASCTPGFEKVFLEDPNYFVSTPDDVKDEEIRVKKPSVWPVENYLNVWIVNSVELGQPVKGFSWTSLDFSTPSPYRYDIIDGIVLDNDYLNVFIHEFGHWADLYHPNFGGFNDENECAAGPGWPAGDNCQYDDQVNDTRPLRTLIPYAFEYYTCEEWITGMYWSYDPNSDINPWCYPLIDGTKEFFQFPVDNIMTYCDPCWERFTPGQYIRMVADFKSRRSSFLNYNDNYYKKVDLSANTVHKIPELLNKMGLNSLSEMCNTDKTYHIVLGGELHLDAGQNDPICFGNKTTIKMLQNAKITVKNNSVLNLNNVHIFGCHGNFWDRIYIESGSTISLDNNTILEYAKTAIEAEKNSNVVINSGIIKNNIVGLKFNDAGTGNNTIIAINNCEIYSDESFNYFMGDILLGRPKCGILIIGQDNTHLNNLTDGNFSFKRLSNGIIADESKVEISNATFHDISAGYNNSIVGNQLFNDGYAVNIKDGIGFSKIRDLKINESQYGIGINKSDAIIEHNIINSTEQGILVNKANSFLISDNTINAYNRGIYASFTYNPFWKFQVMKYPFSISQNRISIIGSDEKAKAIEIENVSGLTIENNFAEIRSNNSGMMINESNTNFVYDNSIDVTGSSNIETTGIELSNVTNHSIINNLISDFTSGSHNIGIYNTTSYAADIQCNEIWNFASGIQFWDNCDNSSLIANKYYTNSKDLVIGSPEAIGDASSSSWIGPQYELDPQTHQISGYGNQWPSPTSTAHNSATFEIVMWSPFKVNAYVNSDYIPDIIEAAGPWFDNKDFYLNLNPCYGVPGSDLVPQCNYLITKIQTIDTMRSIDQCRKLMWQYKYYLQLLKMKKAGQLSDQCLGFLNAQSNNVLVKIAKINIGVDSIGILSQNTATALNTVFTLSMTLDSLENLGQSGTPLWQRTVDQYNSTITQYNTLKQRDEMRDSTKTDSLHTAINGVFVSDTCLATLLKVFGVKLRLMQADTLNHRDITLISQIADACTNELGDGVFLARSIMSLYENKRYRRMEDCIDRGLIPRSDADITKALDKLAVFPNPAGSEVTFNVKTDLEEKGILKLLDTNGKIITLFEINAGNNSVLYNTSSIKNGLYIVEYISEQGFKNELQKLLIIK